MRVTLPQTYVLPIPGGWGILTYGDPIFPEDTIIPLPLTDQVSYEDAESFVRALPATIETEAYVDGWPTMEDLGAMEPELYARVMAG